MKLDVSKISKVDIFSQWTPLADLVKADAKSGRGPIDGIASVETRDQQNELLVQSGIDWDYLLKRGWLNYEHEKGANNVVGVVQRVEPTMYKGSNATRIHGYLLTSSPKGKQLYDLMKALESANSDRQLGLSVEGAKLEKYGNNITKSIVMNVAVCAHPVHQDARTRMVALAKSILSGEIGYQTPAQPSDGSLSPLIPQSIGQSTSSAVEEYSLEDFKKLLRQSHPEWGDEEAHKLASMIFDGAASY